MRLVDVRETVVPISSGIRNAYIDFSEMTVSVVALVSDIVRGGRPVTGYGFNSNGRYAQSGLLNERFLPRLRRAEDTALIDDERGNFDPFSIWNVLMANEKPGGHGERAVAVGIVDMAVWDLVAKVEEKPLWRLLNERYGDGLSVGRVPVYAAGGYYHPNKDVGALRDEMLGYLDLGYTMVKMKIGGATLDVDLERIESALEVLPSGRALAVDANGRFDLEEAMAFGVALEPYELAWYEEPCDPLDYQSHAVLAEQYAGPLATGENLLSLPDTTNLLRHGGLRPDRDVLQMDPALSYGLVEYLRMLAAMRAHGWSPRNCSPHGGHQFNLHVAAALGLGGAESYPGVFEPFGGFADGVPIESGHVALPEVSGIGLEEKAALRPILKSLAESPTQ